MATSVGTCYITSQMFLLDGNKKNSAIFSIRQMFHADTAGQGH